MSAKIKPALSSIPPYIPIQEFYEKIPAHCSPYSCQFSLAPLFEKINPKATKKSDKLSLKVKQFLQELEVAIEEMSEITYWKENPEKITTALQFLLPNLFIEEKIGFLKVPFSESFFYKTPEFRELIETDEWEIKAPSPSSSITEVGHWLLQFFYGITLQLPASETLCFRNKKTGLQKFYKIKIIQDFITAKTLKPLKKISKKLGHELVDNFDDSNLWLEHFPPENFALSGFVIGFFEEVTKLEVVEAIKRRMFEDDYETDHYEHLRQIEQLTCAFLSMPDLRLGVLRTAWSLWQENTSWALLRKFDREIVFPSFEDEKGSYGRLMRSKKMVFEPDLTKKQHLCKIEEKLVKMGYKSLLLAPFFDKNKALVGMVEIASPLPFAFNRLTYLQALPLIEILAEGTNKFLTDLDNLERQTMQNEFTSIHPSVEWRFREVASKLFWEQTIEQQKVAIDPIIFKNLYPMYAQADIVGSSTLRNQSIQSDLEDNLIKVLKVMQFCRKKVSFPLLAIYIQETQKNLDHLQKGQFISSDETRITELITQEIHPLLNELQAHFSKLLEQKIDAYFDHIHPTHNIIYQHRKAYDESVSQLNQMIGQYLEQEDEKMQKILPHHFEKFTTDGVEYNIYLGNALLKDGGFSLLFLKNFRLWQLIMMCEVTRLVAKQGQLLPVPLQTAQLIFVYNNTLSIRFKTEEKHFDVDGTYNVRYEILKKRIDKAVVKGTKERLTLAGKIAIVWLQEKDRKEYWQYLTHLTQEGYIEGEIEVLELEKLQGAAGLKAMRFEVKI